ncbi:MAG: divalent-cation tolerance protein CutA [Calditrichaeota bacterium]|nr:MAG: divalent-cation tolerance protein CutA [Calditrichota bacterium]
MKKEAVKNNLTVAFSTIDNIENARKIAQSLVKNHIVACVNIIRNIESIYFWDDQVCQEPEVLLIMKTCDENVETLKKELPKLHPYEVPELIFFSPKDGLPDYLKWVVATTEKINE